VSSIARVTEPDAASGAEPAVDVEGIVADGAAPDGAVADGATPDEPEPAPDDAA
jgi:hypothetical protein